MNSNKSSDNVLFYSEKIMKDGKMHYSICSYNRVSGIVTYPSDVFDFIKEKQVSVNS